MSWIPNDPRNPNLARDSIKWFWTLLVSFSNFAVTIATSAYTAGAKETRSEFHSGQEVFELGFSVFVLGFAVGPLFWGPLSEVYGRQIIILTTVSLQIFDTCLTRILTNFARSLLFLQPSILAVLQRQTWQAS